MPVQKSPPAKQTRSKAVLTPTPRAPLDGTPAVPQLRAQLERGPVMGGAAPSRKERRGPRRSSSFSGVFGALEEEENSMEEEESDSTEAAPTIVGESQGTVGPTIAQSNKSEQSLLAIMQKITQIITNL
ncbi:hypothetical protein O181_057390 [Austropuccinia psidii MF-1]|uniref:Uncharacterized protein n=1 Tax=Austropuccinia psidii MF-1 TaxID=1389203 RepID=A0A9Q3HWY9_9BASI|nr:hypothetical protein [Austropuccinia psidii MF-1]